MFVEPETDVVFFKVFFYYNAVFPNNGVAGHHYTVNKGIKIATGDVVGILNADDFFADSCVLSDIAKAFNNTGADALYGNLDYLKPNGRVMRRWVSGSYKAALFNWGWMPPHPTFYCKRLLFNKLGLYDVNFGTAADYELMLRFLYQNKLKVHYLDKVMVKMETGGASNQSIKSRVKAWKSDFRAMGKNGVMFPQLCVIFKPLRKLVQYI